MSDSDESSASSTSQAETTPSSVTGNNLNNSAEAQQPPKPSNSSSPSGADVPDQSAAFEAIEMLRATARMLRTTAQQLMCGIDNLSAQIDHLASSFRSGSNTGPLGAASSECGVRGKLKRSFSDFTPLGDGGSSTAKKPNRTKSEPSECTDCGFTGE